MRWPKFGAHRRRGSFANAPVNASRRSISAHMLYAARLRIPHAPTHRCAAAEVHEPGAAARRRAVDGPGSMAAAARAKTCKSALVLPPGDAARPAPSMPCAQRPAGCCGRRVACQQPRTEKRDFHAQRPIGACCPRRHRLPLQVGRRGGSGAAQLGAQPHASSAHSGAGQRNASRPAGGCSGQRQLFVASSVLLQGPPALQMSVLHHVQRGAAVSEQAVCRPPNR